jgi:hypothetical protein
MPKIATAKGPSAAPRPSPQLNLFYRPDPMSSELKKIRIDEVTPLEALNILAELKRRAEKEGEKN